MPRPRAGSATPITTRSTPRRQPGVGEHRGQPLRQLALGGRLAVVLGVEVGHQLLALGSEAA